MNENALTTTDTGASIMPVVSSSVMLQRYHTIVEIKDTVMEAGVHYGVIPGSAKPSLWKPGAETLCTAFRLYPDYEDLERPNLTQLMNQAKGVPFFMYRYRCILRTQDGQAVAGTGIGSCNSWEKKYRYRRAERVCPHCQSAAIIKGKAEYGGGWLCWSKKGGCGAKFNDGDIAIEGQDVGDTENTDIAELINTIDKMAQKRALIAATLVAVGASNFFTQDIEDLPEFAGSVIEGEAVPFEPDREPASTPHPAVTKGPAYPPGEKLMSELTGAEVYAIRKGIHERLGMNHERHFENRYAHHYGALALAEVTNPGTNDPLTVAEFEDVMRLSSEEYEDLFGGPNG